MSSPRHGYTKVNKTQGIPTVCLIESGYPRDMSMIWKAVWRHNCLFSDRLTVCSATLVDIRMTVEPQNVWEDEDNLRNAIPSKLKDSLVLCVLCYWNEMYSSNAGKVRSYANFISKITEKNVPPPPLYPCRPLLSPLSTCLLFLLLILLLVSTFTFHGPSSAPLCCQFLILLLALLPASSSSSIFFFHTCYIFSSEEGHNPEVCHPRCVWKTNS